MFGHQSNKSNQKYNKHRAINQSSKQRPIALIFLRIQQILVTFAVFQLLNRSFPCPWGRNAKQRSIETVDQAFEALWYGSVLVTGNLDNDSADYEGGTYEIERAEMVTN